MPATPDPRSHAGKVHPARR